VSGKRSRPLTADDHAVWDGVTRSIKPLRRRVSAKASPASEAKAAQAKAATNKAATKSRPAALAPARPATRPAPAPIALDRKTRQKLARGSQPIDARIDLHGLTQSEAHHALARFLRNAQDDGARFVLVITGKGGPRIDADHAARDERGVLRRQVPLWLKLPEFRAYVVGFEQAHVGHGGVGALYVQVKRR
jgi:DNA-nicking Smr family endonuclease